MHCFIQQGNGGARARVCALASVGAVAGWALAASPADCVALGSVPTRSFPNSPPQIPALRPREYSRLAKSKRSVNRVYGGHLAAGVVRERIVRAFLVEEQKIVKKVLKLQKAKEASAAKKEAGNKAKSAKGAKASAGKSGKKALL